MSASLALLGVLCAAPCKAAVDDYVPQAFRAAEVVPQKKIAELKPEQKLRIGDIEVKNETDGFIMKGKTKSGLPWKFQQDPVGLGGDLFQCDLDRNGTKDLLLLRATGACGAAPYSELTVMLFDKNNLPHCYGMTGYFNTTDNDKAIEEVVRVGNRGPFILQQQLVYGPLRERSKNYWRNQVYKPSNSKLDVFRGSIGGTKVPCYVWYKYKPNHQVASYSATLDAATKSQHKEATELKVLTDAQ